MGLRYGLGMVLWLWIIKGIRRIRETLTRTSYERGESVAVKTLL